jgi:23S rRNA pseudouridine2605 synthase
LSTPQPPSAAQLSAARLAHWRQNAATGTDVQAGALLTLDSARQFVSTCGLLLFIHRPQHISSPAPSFVEATLGLPNAFPSLAEVNEARILLSRLIAEGSAVPLNLLGTPTTNSDTPDFIASASALSYVFTLRGEKAFKQLPSTSGATKVSPLALNTYSLLLENGPSTASDLATVLGKEVTETAVLRALNELWQHLRVLPVPRPDGGATLWETITNRFTKQLKAGANAGQPSALSALISLYLSQALLATETEIETFLSPLAPRSRVRDVIHALAGARQLESIAVEGKTHLHIHGELPSFSMSSTNDGIDQNEIAAAGELALADDGSRIKKFIPKPHKVGTGYVERAKPFRDNARPAGDTRTSGRKTSSLAAERGLKSRPPSRAFNKPWEEEKQQRSGRAAGTEHTAETQFQDLDLNATSTHPVRQRPSSSTRPFGKRSEDPTKLAPRPAFGRDRPAFGRNREQNRENLPPRRNESGGTAPGFEGRKSRPQSGFGGPIRTRPPFGDKERRPFRRDEAGGAARPPRREFSADRNDADRTRRESFSKAKPFRDRPDRKPAAIGRPERPPFRKFDAPRAPRKPSPPREGGTSQPPRRDFAGRSGFASGGKNPFPRSAGTEDSRRRDGSSFGRRNKDDAGNREGSGFMGRKPTGSKPPNFSGKKPFAGKAEGRRGMDAPGASTFDKFKSGNKPWGKRPPGRKPKPEEAES